ncbi:hypothetical protein RHGRI_004452 [Rhododendron griersonianum]|uniref:Thioredoxin domain-containing protein n=2 Tax=Rhododendron TaxID=4346 RepID=A0AAV6LAH6_9ERIC
MERQEEEKKSRVVKIGSKESWESYVSQATNQGSPEVATKYDVKAMPTFLLMKAGAQVDKLVGANPDEIKKRIEGLVQSYQVYLA